MTALFKKVFAPGLLRRLPRDAKDHLIYCLWDGFFALSYSQEGEDILLNRLFDSKKGGFYVDVGAHHPKRFSNTYYFYRRGWSGINIDAMPGSMAPFQKERDRDINLQIGVGKSSGDLSFYMFKDGALNTFDAEIAGCREMDGAGVSRKVLVPVQTLAEILDAHLPAGKTVDFLSVDAEGLDLEVLESNDWEKYRPHIIVVEVFGCTAEAAMNHAISAFLAQQGYELIAKTLNTAFYRVKS